MSYQFRMLLDIVDTAMDRSTFSHALKTLAANQGFSHYAYLSLAGDQVKYLGDYPPLWERLYLKARLDKLDPVIARARHSAGTFTWSASEWMNSNTPGIKAFAVNAIEHGIMHGMSISARASFDTQLILSFCSPDLRRRPTSLDTSDAIPLLMGLHYRLTPILGMRQHAIFSPLSSRETLCLIWAAKGKTAPETATITGLSPRTVQHYLDAARYKLRASTISHLIAIAKDIKLI